MTLVFPITYIETNALFKSFLLRKLKLPYITGKTDIKNDTFAKGNLC